ncbi:hypothetical protein [Lysinibacillus xylanilyticus]|uniref:hypothetical protein n=1 Tax=Lysinibacillus xylanilyticus TaxID=582475 RepID=UPI003828A437
MTEKYSFFNDVNGDREYDMEAFALFFKQFLSNGLYHSDNVPALNVTKGTGLKSVLSTGSAYIEGFMYLNDAPITLTHDVADITNSRIDRIVLRLDRNLNARYIKSFVKKGTAATSPVAPSLTRNSLVWEISLAQVRINANANTVTSVTDERFNSTVCGLVSSLITVPTESFITQWNEFMAQMEQSKKEYRASWDAWFASIQNQIGVRVLTGTKEPTGAAAGDIWFKG